ncbi:MAG TPA: DUF2076 domain-containing protein [Pseudolabrys sp.]|jgi:hypothetical protein
MTPQERQLVEDLFGRLERLESAPRDAEAERVIADGLRHAPNAIYPLVQTVLVQDEALKRADARIRQLTGEDVETTSGGFLDSMRQVLTGRSGSTSVPSVRPGAPDARWNSGTPSNPYAAPVQGSAYGGGSFLGTAAASAAGMIGGALLLNSISSMFGHHGGSAFAAVPQQGNSPWDSSASSSELARDAGINDVGGDSQSATLFGNDEDAELVDDFDSDAGGDFDGDFGGDSA